MGIERGEYYSLMIFSICGMMLMACAFDLMIVFVALELLSIPLYVLAGFAYPRPESQESALKYFFLGTFAAAFLLYGIALVFGATGHTDLPGILMSASTAPLSPALLLVGTALVLVGFAFKTAIVPFHQWVPDVYQGAPTPVTAFMSISAKSAGIAALLRVFVIAFPAMGGNYVPILWGLAAISMLLGNIVAINQSNIKRMLGYSSIASGGYLLMAFVPYGQGAVQADTIDAMLLYLMGYALTSLAAWGVVIALEQEGGKGLQLKDLAGLSLKHPWLALAMTAAMLSYIGAPLTLGFWGKFYLFRTTLEGGFTGLAALGLLASVVSAFYYLRVVVMMYMRTGEPEVRGDFWLYFVTLAAAAALVVFGFIPGPILEMVIRSTIH
jgi:NADH-quinone oxidoreductase subunit N